MTKWSWVLLAYLSLICYGLIDNTRGPLYPAILKTFDMTTTKGSLFFSISSMSGLVTNLLAAWWLPRFKALKSIKFFIVMLGISCLGLGASGEFSWGYINLLCSCVFLGISLAGIGFCVNILVAQSTVERYRRQCLSGLHSMYGISSLVAPAFIALWFNKALTWSSAFFALAVAPLLLGIFSFLLMREEDSEDCVSSRKHKKILSSDLQEVSGHQKSQNEFYISYSLCLIFGFIFAFGVAAEISLSTQIPLFCDRVLLWDEARSSWQLSLFFLFLVAGRLIFSVFPFSGKSYHWLLLSTFGGAVTYLIGLYLNPFFLPFSGFFISIFYPCGVEWMDQLFKESMHKVYSVATITMSLFIIFMHTLIGKFTEVIGLREALLIGPIMLFLSFLLILIFKKRRWMIPSGP